MPAPSSAPLPSSPAQAVTLLLDTAHLLVVGLDCNGRVSWLNNAAAAITGYDPAELTGRLWWEIMAPRTRFPEVWQEFARLTGGGAPRDFEHPILTKTGEERFFAWRISPERKGNTVVGTVWLGVDLTDRHRVEEALRASEERMRFALEGTDDGLWDVHLATGSVYLSPRGCEILGYQPDELPAVAAVWSDLVNPDDLPRTQERLAAYLAGNAAIFEVEQRLRTKAGEWKWVLARGKVFERDDAGQLRRMTGTHTDISARKQMEADLAQTHRALRTLSECNQALVNASDESALLHKICRLIVEFGGYRMTWVGYAEHDDARTVRPVAAEGFGAGYLEQARVTWADTGPSEGPTGACLRSGELCVCRRIPDDPRFAALRDEALRRGYASSIALPLKADGQTFGALSIYAAEPEAFGAAEVRLLTELAKDLAYGVAALRGQGKRRQAEAALRESEERFRRLFESSLDAVLLTSPGGPVLGANAAACTLFGWTEEEICRGGRAGLVDPTDPRLPVLLDERARTGRVLGELRFLRRDGTPFEAEVSSALFTDQHGQQRSSMVIRDITARKQAEATLRESEARFRSAVETAPDAIFIQSQGRFAYINAAALRLFGATTADALLGQPVLERFAPDHRERVAERIRQLNLGAEPVPLVEEDCLRLDGGIVHVEVSAVPFMFQNAAGALVFARDLSARKQAEAALLRSEEKFAAAFANNPAAVALTRLDDGRFLEVNRTWESLLGYRRQDILGRSARDMGIWPAPEAAARFTAALRTHGFLHDWEQVFCKSSGETFIAQLSAQCLTMHGETVILSTLVDITDRKRTEAALRASEDRYRSLIETSFDWVWEVDAQARYTYASPRVKDLLGYEPEQVLGRTPFDLMPETEAHRVRALYQSYATQRQPFTSLENVNHHRDGRLVVLESSGAPVFGPDGTWLGYRGMDRDITARQTAERSIRLQGAALEAAANAVVITDRAGTIEWVNPAFTALSGWTLAEAAGQNLRALVKSGEHDAAFYRQMWETILAGQVWRGEIVNRRKDGSQRTEEMTITPLHNEAGEIGHFIAIKQDVTERKMMETQFLQGQRTEAIGALAGGIAHDLNNILAPIMMVSGLLQDKLSEESDRELLALLQGGAKRGADIIKQLLMFSRGQPGERTRMHPRHLIKEMMGLMRETFPRDIDLRVEVADALWPVVADPTQLHQVLLNLCVNARDAMPNGGSLTIGTANVTLAAGAPSLPPGAQPGPYLAMTVSDTGLGIPPEIRHRIFDPFFTTKPLGKGTGLGLSTVLGIVRSHGGFVTVDSKPRQGTAFKVFLPAIPNGTETAAEKPLAPNLATGDRQTILVVEDERDIREATRILLERNQHCVLTATQGADALIQYLKHRGEVKLVITDLMMPVMNGMALIRALRAIDPDLKILAATGLNDSAKSAELEALGVPLVLLKPTDNATLLNAVHRQLQRD